MASRNDPDPFIPPGVDHRHDPAVTHLTDPHVTLLILYLGIINLQGLFVIEDRLQIPKIDVVLIPVPLLLLRVPFKLHNPPYTYRYVLSNNVPKKALAQKAGGSHVPGAKGVRPRRVARVLIAPRPERG